MSDVGKNIDSKYNCKVMIQVMIQDRRKLWCPLTMDALVTMHSDLRRTHHIFGEDYYVDTMFCEEEEEAEGSWFRENK